MGVSEWVIIDTETTGLIAPIYTLEIAAQRMKGLQPIGPQFRVFLNHNVDIPPGAQAVHGYSRDYLAQHGVAPIEGHRRFFDYVGERPLVSYNLAYDYDQVLIPEWRRLGFTTAMTSAFCMMRLTQRLISPSPAGNYKLQSLREYFRLPARDAHSALGDVLTVIDLLNSVLAPHLTQRDLNDAQSILSFLKGAGYSDHLPFGKHKGRHWRDALDDSDMESWLEWLASRGDPAGSKMANWYLGQIQKLRETETTEKSEGEEIHYSCPHCNGGLLVTKGWFTANCPLCKQDFVYDTR